MTDVREFRRACYEAACRTGGNVMEFRIVHGVTPNFHQGIIAYQDHAVAVTYTRDSALLAVAEPRSVDVVEGRKADPLEFVDAPELVTVLAEQSGFRVLTAADLSVPFDAVAWPDIQPTDIKYWGPANLGEALFNYWD